MTTYHLKGFLEENSLPEEFAGAEPAYGGGKLQGVAQSFYRFLRLTLPYADIGGYDTDFFAEFAEHAAGLLRTEERCRDIPENIFLWYVLHPRVNNEELSACRRLFHDKLGKRLKGLAPEEAVQVVNRWCAEHVTYRSTDERTASALSVYRTGFGRCGEESVFAVNAYRSVGIPARQVYAPWWSHCDDNHAWVEVWLQGQWRFLGACEPEPILNRGWFTEASSRAMLVHSKRFCRLPEEQIRVLEPDEKRDRLVCGSILYENVTGRYAETNAVTIHVRDAGEPVPYAPVSLQVLNMASFRDLITFRCDRQGNAEIDLGSGSLRVCAADGNRRAALLADTGDSREITVDLGQNRLEPVGSFRMRAPKESFKNSAALTAEQKKSRNAVLEQTTGLRAARWHSTVIPEGLERITSTLTEKDRVDIRPDLLLRHQAFMERYERDYPVHLYEKYLLCPRLGNEPLSLYAEAADNFFNEEQKNRFRFDPKEIACWIDENINKIGPELSFLPAKPAAVLQTLHGTEEDCRVLFAAIARSCGIPAYVKDGLAFYYQENAFHPADGHKADPAHILCEDFTQDMLSAFSLCRIGELQENPVCGWDAGGQVPVPPGEYRLTAVNRLPNGDLLANSSPVSCMAAETVRIKPAFPSAEPEELLQNLPLEPFSLKTEGETVASSELVRQGKRIFLWLDPGREPTEHILNELLALSEKDKDLAEELCLIVEETGKCSDPLLGRVLKKPGIHPVYFDGDPEDKTLIARRLYLEPDRLPLILLMDGCHKVLYAVSGYNVGTAELLLKIQNAAFLFDKKRGSV